MRRQSHKLLDFLTSTLLTITVCSAHAAEKLSDTSKVWLRGIGPVQVGMTIAKAEKAAGVKLEKGYTKGDCAILSPATKSPNVKFVAIKDKIVSVHIYSPSPIKTRSNVGIDNTEQQLKAAYPNQIQLLGTPVSDGDTFRILAFVPKDKADQNYRVIFTVHLDKVQDFAAGLMPQVKDRCP
jgi:hypothetical protein